VTLAFKLMQTNTKNYPLHPKNLKAATSLILRHSDPIFTARVYVHPTMEMKKNAMAKMSDIISKQ